MIYFTKEGLGTEDRADACLLAPTLVYSDGRAAVITEEGEGKYTADGCISIEDSVQYLGGGRFAITREIVNNGTQALSFCDVLSVRLESPKASR